MKIAICIFGVHSDYRCVEFIQKMSKKYNTTVFLHCWDYNKSWYPRKSPFNKQRFDVNNIDLHIRSTLYENVIDELKNKQKMFMRSDSFSLPDIGFISLLYGMAQVANLKNKIQATNKNPYDCVFCMTFNTFIDRLIDIKNFDMEVLNTIYNCESPINPYFIFGNSEYITKFCDLYNSLEKLDPKLHQDFWLQTHTKHLPITKFWFQSDIGNN